MATDEHINRVGRCLAGAARVAFDQRAVITDTPLLKAMAAEAAGLYDCLDGLELTNPEQRARLHLQALSDLAGQLPVLDGGAR